MKLFKKFWEELTRLRSINIEFVSYETEEETNQRYKRELNEQIRQIRERNSKQLYLKLEPEIINKFIKKEGYFPSSNTIVNEFIKELEERLRTGKVDKLFKETEINA